MMSQVIYKIVSRPMWEDAKNEGLWSGAPIDRQDGYIHFSTADQAQETATKHFAGQNDLLLVAFSVADLGDKLVFEPSRGGALFPHLYSKLDTNLALWARAIASDEAGIPQIGSLDDAL